MLDPNDTFELYLDESAPETVDRPTLIYRYRSARDWMEFSRKHKAAASSQTDVDYGETLAALAVDGLVGWRNIRTIAGEPLPTCDPSRLIDVVTFGGLADLVGRLPLAATVSERDRKKSASPSPSSSGQSGNGV